MRNTGIDVIGRVPWGTHFCQFYHNKQDLVEVLVPYFASGLRDNECCMWVTSAPLEVEEAKEALELVVGDLTSYLQSGQLQVLDFMEWYTPGGAFDAGRVLQGWVERLAEARERGFEGLRLSGNTYWLEQATWNAFTDYEASINRVIGQYPMMVMCTYSLARCGVPEILDVVANHAFALIKQGGVWHAIESTERKRAEEALKRREALYRTIARSLPDGCVCVVDQDLRCLVAEGPLLTKLGLKRELLEGTVVSQAVDEEARRVLEPRFRRALSGAIDSFETEHRGRALSFKFLPITDDAGVPFGAMSMATDVTRYRAANRALKEALGRERRLARENEEAREHLVKLLAHEIRNPMAGLKGLAQLTERRAGDEKGREIARLMACEVDRLSRILTEVLDAFRTHSGNLQLESRLVDLAQVITAAVDFGRAGGNHVYEVQVDGPVMVMGDALRLEDVIRNLCSNAEKYSAAGTVIRVKLAATGGWARVSVQDEGVGIPPGEVGRVFEEFFRASNVVFRGPGGTGLGLYLCKSVVERHGGRIWVESKEGEGSTVFVELPLAGDQGSALSGGLAAGDR